MGAKNFIGSLSDAFGGSISNVFKVYQEKEKVKKLFQARVLYVSSRGVIEGLHEDEKIFADLNIVEDLARIKGLDRIFFIIKKHVDTRGQHVVFLSEGYHRNIDLEKYYRYVKIKKKDDKLLDPNELLFKKEFEDVENAKTEFFKTLKGSDFQVTIDMNYSDHHLAKELTVDAAKILDVNMFKLLEDTPNRTIYMMLIIGFLGGSVFTGGLGFLFIITLEFIKLLGSGG